MGELVKGIADFLAALLRAVGFVGTPRRRAGIRDDLQLLREFEEFPPFASGSDAHQWLTERIRREIADFSGAHTPATRRAIPWGSVVVAAAISAFFGWLTYKLDRSGVPWYFLLLPGFVGGLMFLVTLTMLGNKEQVEAAEKT